MLVKAVCYRLSILKMLWLVKDLILLPATVAKTLILCRFLGT